MFPRQDAAREAGRRKVAWANRLIVGINPHEIRGAFFRQPLTDRIVAFPCVRQKLPVEDQAESGPINIPDEYLKG
jgi:hypothetical protein